MQVERRLQMEGNAALVRGGLYAAVLGLTSGALVLALLALGLARDLLLPVLFAFFAGGCSLALWAAARAGRLRGPLAWAVMLSFVSLPTLFFIASHFLLPSGAASYITGPISYLYLVIIAITGFLFDRRLSAASGLVAAAGYLAAYALAIGPLQQIEAADPILRQDLTAPPIYLVKAFMMGFGGFVVGGMASVAKRLILKMLDEEAGRERVSRLFGQYVSEEVKDRILAEQAEIAGERKQVAVLFSDLRGFSSWSERTDPAQIVERLNEYFEAMVACIAAEGGVVDKFIGDAVMAVFGGVLPHSDPCGASVRAALRMRERLAELNRGWAARGLPPLDNGIGIHFGEVLQGAIGSAHRKDFTVIGDAVNTASRIEGLTKDYPQKILITEELRRELKPAEQARCAPQGKVHVKGKQEEVAIWGVA